MLKLTFNKDNINIPKLHAEIGDLGLDYYLTHDGDSFYITLPTLFKREQQILNDDGEVVDTSVSYEVKSSVTEVVQDDEGNEVEIIKDVFSEYDFASLQSKIDDVISKHDPTPLPQIPTSEERLEQLENVLLMML